MKQILVRNNIEKLPMDEGKREHKLHSMELGTSLANGRANGNISSLQSLYCNALFKNGLWFPTGLYFLVNFKILIIFSY